MGSFKFNRTLMINIFYGGNILLFSAFCLHAAQTEAVYLPDWVVGPTVITVNLSYADSTQVW